MSQILRIGPLLFIPIFYVILLYRKETNNSFFEQMIERESMVSLSFPKYHHNHHHCTTAFETMDCTLWRHLSRSLMAVPTSLILSPVHLLTVSWKVSFLERCASSFGFHNRSLDTKISEIYSINLFILHTIELLFY